MLVNLLYKWILNKWKGADILLWHLKTKNSEQWLHLNGLCSELLFMTCILLGHCFLIMGLVLFQLKFIQDPSVKGQRFWICVISIILKSIFFFIFEMNKFSKPILIFNKNNNIYLILINVPFIYITKW